MWLVCADPRLCSSSTLSSCTFFKVCLLVAVPPSICVAFLLMDAKECLMSAEEIFLAKIEKFINIHQNSFLVLSAALHGPEEWKLMFRIQQRFLGSNLRILPVHNTVNAINLMCTIAKTTSKPYIDSICYRMMTTKAYITEQSTVWKTLQKLKLGSDSFTSN
ncbi:uncharacterized protein C1orf146 homolog isoform X2 [Choloepus didactylus]|uniref:uncharacterized protein C1orf146 homolog isoform X2 n=1 Tax=Choloepus didactylus TaxID=27675 RepID=UPI00189D5B11|nr:uncharacterized protein C1orf146 homolog isoform X2 [Choloepus didactylus]